MKTTPTILLSAITLLASAFLASAQDAPPQNRGDRGDRGNRGGTPEEFRARMATMMKTSLKVTDDEWGILQPLIEKVTTKQREGMSGRFGGFGGRGGGPGGDRGGDRGGAPGTSGTTGTSDRPGAAENQALRDALEKEGTSAADIAAKLNAVREQRKKSATELAAARAELQKVVTARQEAVLFSMGILE